MGPRTNQHETVTSEVAGAAIPAANPNGINGADACNVHAKAFQDENDDADGKSDDWMLSVIQSLRKALSMLAFQMVTTRRGVRGAESSGVRPGVDSLTPVVRGGVLRQNPPRVSLSPPPHTATPSPQSHQERPSQWHVGSSVQYTVISDIPTGFVPPVTGVYPPPPVSYPPTTTYPPYQQTFYPPPASFQPQPSIPPSPRFDHHYGFGYPPYGLHQPYHPPQYHPGYHPYQQAPLVTQPQQPQQPYPPPYPPQAPHVPYGYPPVYPPAYSPVYPPVYPPVRPQEFEQAPPVDWHTRLKRNRMQDFHGNVEPLKAEMWLRSFEKGCRNVNVPETEMAQVAAGFLLSTEESWFDALESNRGNITDWKEFKELFYNEYYPPAVQANQASLFLRCSQGQNTTVSQYTNRFNELGRFYPEIMRVEEKNMALYKNGLSREIQAGMMGASPRNMAELLNKAIEVETFKNMPSMIDGVKRNFGTSQGSSR